jgi:hypothetical protein
MTTRTFEVEFSRYGIIIDSATIQLDNAVIDAVDDSWREMLYSLYTPEDIARHIAYNMVINRLDLSQLDGWADQPNSNARMIYWPDLDEYDMTAREIET